MRITPDDVGRRVTVRSRIADPGPSSGPSATDTLGILRSWSDGRLVIERRDGTRVTLDEAALLAGRTIPDPPPRRPRRYSA